VLHLRDLKPGVTLGRYEILMPVAQGGMAAVWAARMVGSRGFQKIVAIKTMLPGLSEDSEFEAMFLDEAGLAARIRHPHVCEILDLGDENGMLYIVMEWVNGETLFVLNRAAKDKGGFPLPLLLRLLSSTCAGLHAAHEMRDEEGRALGLVHRDINPANIMVSYDGIVKIVDFGVAKATARVSITRVPGMLKGKAHYLSPEQVRGESIDRRSDIFSLGILMYVMITGRHPFKGETDKQTMDNIVSAIPVPISDLMQGVRSDLEAVVMRALEKNPDERWSDCAELQRSLDQISNAISAAVTDGDVAKFVRSVVGDRSERRRQDLSASIQAADARGPGVDGAPSRRRDIAETTPSSKHISIPPASRGASLEGIIPISLEDKPVVPAEPPPQNLRVELTSLPPGPAPLVPVQRKTPKLPWILLAAVVILSVGAITATRFGWVPGPGQTSPSAAPPEPLPSPSVAPSAPPNVPPPASASSAAATPTDAGADAEPTDASADVATDASSNALDGGRIEGDAGWYFENGFWHPPPGWKHKDAGAAKAANGSRKVDASNPYHK